MNDRIGVPLIGKIFFLGILLTAGVVRAGEIEEMEARFGQGAAETNQTPASPQGQTQPGGRPGCPAGWAQFNNPMLGMQASVPPGFFVRLLGGTMLTVVRMDGQPFGAFMVPFRPKRQMSPAQLAKKFGQFWGRCDPKFRGQITGQPTPSRAVVAFTTVMSNQPVEGRYCVVSAAGGSMAFTIGVFAPQGQLQANLPMLKQIAGGFGFTRPQGRWRKYRSPGNGFTLTIPAGWHVETTEGKIAKNEVDWTAYNPRNPMARAFSITPKFCSKYLLQNPLYQMRGYKVAEFQSPQQCIQTSMSQFFGQPVRLISMRPNPELTQLVRKLQSVAIQTINQLGAGQMDMAVFNCFAETNVQGVPIRVAFCAAITTLTLEAGIMGRPRQTDVWCQGWFAPVNQFINVSPVLDKIQGSHAYTAHYVRAVLKAEGQRGKIIRDTWKQMNRIDQQINREHWRTQDAIYEMYGDHWADMGGYVNKKTGRIEKMEPRDLIKNSSGQIVSREEIQSGVSPDQATPLRDAYSNDYMKGVYGRIEFY